MSITAAELKSSLGKYLLLAATEDIFSACNGKVIAKLSNPYQDRGEIAKSRFGVLLADLTPEKAFAMSSTTGNIPKNIKQKILKSFVSMSL